jgi:hypothetical protein
MSCYFIANTNVLVDTCAWYISQHRSMSPGNNLKKSLYLVKMVVFNFKIRKPLRSQNNEQ